ncbi:MAG: hypothetical protein CMJ25_14610 [Phycisphaerae bacterium]|nr:hypothetical protein [Phycisphaerae bacterium]|tara:strand:- start:329 stop:565 length:237 start_codon:yes stop_codon:yes gene_type:complete
MYYSAKSDSGVGGLIIYSKEKTIKSLGKYYQKCFDSFGGNANQEYIVFKGKPNQKTFLGFYVLESGKLKKKKSTLWEI